MQTSLTASSRNLFAELSDCLDRAKKWTNPQWRQPTDATKRVSQTFSRVPDMARAFNCRLFHHKRLMGPFGDVKGSYFLCEVGHRIPVTILPAAKPRPKPKVWNQEDSGQAV